MRSSARSRDAEQNPFVGLRELGILKKMRVILMDIRSIDSVKTAVTQVLPDEIYNLSGQSLSTFLYGPDGGLGKHKRWNAQPS